MEYRELILSALEAREKAYCPYSNFKVGAAVLLRMEKYMMEVILKMLLLVEQIVLKEQLFLKVFMKGIEKFRL